MRAELFGEASGNVQGEKARQSLPKCATSRRMWIRRCLKYPLDTTRFRSTGESASGCSRQHGRRSVAYAAVEHEHNAATVTTATYHRCVTESKSNSLKGANEIRCHSCFGVLLGAAPPSIFLGIAARQSYQGQAVQPPDAGRQSPGNGRHRLEQSFIDAVLSTTFSGLGTPTFQLGQYRGKGRNYYEQALPGG